MNKLLFFTLFIVFLLSARLTLACPFSDRNISFQEGIVVSAYVFLHPDEPVPIEQVHYISDEEIMLLEVNSRNEKADDGGRLYDKGVFFYLHKAGTQCKLSVEISESYMLLYENDLLYGGASRNVEDFASFDRRNELRSAFFRVPARYDKLMKVFNAENNLLEMVNTWSFPGDITVSLPKLRCIYSPQFNRSLQVFSREKTEELPKGISCLNGNSYAIFISKEDMSIDSKLAFLSSKKVISLSINLVGEPEKVIFDLSRLASLEALRVFTICTEAKSKKKPVEVKLNDEVKLRTLKLCGCEISSQNLSHLLRGCVSFTCYSCRFTGKELESDAVTLEDVNISDTRNEIDDKILLSLISNAGSIIYCGNNFPVYSSSTLKKLCFFYPGDNGKALLDLRGHTALECVEVDPIIAMRSRTTTDVDVRLHSDQLLAREISFQVRVHSIIRVGYPTKGEISLIAAPIRNIHYYTHNDWQSRGSFYFF